MSHEKGDNWIIDKVNELKFVIERQKDYQFGNLLLRRKRSWKERMYMIVSMHDKYRLIVVLPVSKVKKVYVNRCKIFSLQ